MLSLFVHGGLLSWEARAHILRKRKVDQMLSWLYLRNGTGVLDDMPWSINSVCVRVGLWFSKEKKQYRFRDWSSAIGNTDSDQKSCLLWILFFFLPAFHGDFYSCLSGSMVVEQRVTKIQIFQWDTTDDDGMENTLQYSRKKKTNHKPQSWPCTRRTDVTELGHLHSRLQTYFL